MKKLVNCCDECEKIGHNLYLEIIDNKELCEMCIRKIKYKLRLDIQNKNFESALKLKACNKCNQTGLLHRSMYTCGPGYYDEPDPSIYCNCPRGLALNPSTDFIVTEDI